MQDGVVTLGAPADTCPPRLLVENAGDEDERETIFVLITHMLLLLLHVMQSSVGQIDFFFF